MASDRISRAQSIKAFNKNEEVMIDQSRPKIIGLGLNLPDFLKKRAMKPKLVDPMEDAFNLRAQAGDPKKANPNVKPPIDQIFKLKQAGPDKDGNVVEHHVAQKDVMKPPKAVYVKRNRKELYDHKLVQKPFNWYDQKTAKQTLKNFLDENKDHGEIQDVQKEIRKQVVRRRDVKRNFDKENNTKQDNVRDTDEVNPDEQKDSALTKEVWSVFGKYISNQLKKGRAVNVPSFGLFTFTHPNHLDMAGLTNPDYRDPQTRTPIFVVVKDYVKGKQVRPGIANSMTHDVYLKNEAQSQANVSIKTIGGSSQRVIPFDVKHLNGIIPKHDINWTEVSQMIGSSKASKGRCKELCEVVFRKYSERAHSGYKVDVEIPHLGRLFISVGLCAVIFNSDLISATYGATAINYQKRFHSALPKNNLMNEKNLDQGKPKADFLRRYGAGFNELKRKLDEDYDSQKENLSIQDLMSEINNDFQTKRIQPQIRPDPSKQNPRANYCARSMKSLRSARGSVGALSRSASSVAFSAMSMVPELDPVILMSIAWEVYQLRSSLVAKAQQQKIGLREVLTSTKIQKLLQCVSYPVKIGNLKALLKELGFNWNGASCSLTQLVEKLKAYTRDPHIDKVKSLINAERLAEGEKTGMNKPVDQETLHKMVKNAKDESRLAETLAQILYNKDVKSLYAVFSEYAEKEVGTDRQVMRLESFKKFINRYAKGIFTSSEIELIFQDISQGADKMLSQQFINALTIEKEEITNEVKLKLVSRIQDWLLKRGYSAEQGFERILAVSYRTQQQTIGRYDFQKAILSEFKNEFNLKTIDTLFEILLQSSKMELSKADWLAQIKTQETSPLTELRNIIKARGMSSKQVEKELNFNDFQTSLNYNQFCEAVRRFWPTISANQLTKLFNHIADPKSKSITVIKFVRNISGSDYGTVDHQKVMFKKLYDQLYTTNASKVLMQNLEAADNNNDGLIEPDKVVSLIAQSVSGGITFEEIELFVANLPKVQHKVRYVDMIDLITSNANKNHNAFKTLVQKLDGFFTQNKMSTESLLQRLGSSSQSVPVGVFAKFLKDKVDKSKDLSDLEQYAKMMDIDKDGYINLDDLSTCLQNQNSYQFYRNGGQNLKHSQFNTVNKFFRMDNVDLQKNDPKIKQIVKQINQQIKKESLKLRGLFNKFDSDGDGMVNQCEFQSGIQSLLTVNQPTLEKIFNLMDTHGTGMVTFEQFADFFYIKDPEYNLVTHVQLPEQAEYSNFELKDSFDWQNEVVEKIKVWFRSQKIHQRELELTPEDVFKSFDMDFDGKVDKQDMTKALINLIKVNHQEINELRIERLIHMLSFTKISYLTLPDFERMLNKDFRANNYTTKGISKSTQNLAGTCLGGSLYDQSPQDWIFSCIKQIGLFVSKKGQTVEKSFEQASQNTNKVNFEMFKAYLQKYNILEGFQITDVLYQKIFAELDPHKKTYLSLADWKSSFGIFQVNDDAILSYKNFMSLYFADIDSAYAFYQQFGDQFKLQIDYDRFLQANKSLFGDNYFKESQLRNLFSQINTETVFHSFSLKSFTQFFDKTKFSGKQQIQTKKDKTLDMMGKKGAEARLTKAKLVQSFDESILARLRVLINQAGLSVENIFRKYDTDGSGWLSRIEFRRALREMNLGLSILEINEVIELVDRKVIPGNTRYDLLQRDGKIDLYEFKSKLYDVPENEQRMYQRANQKLVLLKENMVLHMHSTSDAYRMYNKHKKGFMTFKEFEKLVFQLSDYCGEKMPRPNHTILKDIFDIIDQNKDGLLDFKEWTNTFQYLGVPESGTVCQPEPQTLGVKNAVKLNEVTSWENGKEHKLIGQFVAKNRHQIQELLRKHSSHSSFDGVPKYVTFVQAKTALDDVLYKHFQRKGIHLDDQKLACLLSAGLVNQRLSSNVQKVPPAFGPGYYEERPKKQNLFDHELYDINKIIQVYKERHID